MKKIFLILLCLTFVGCSSTAPQEEVSNNKEPEVTTNQNKIEESETTRVTTTTLNSTTKIEEETTSKESSQKVFTFSYQLDSNKTFNQNAKDIQLYIYEKFLIDTDIYKNYKNGKEYAWIIKLKEAEQKGTTNIQIGEMNGDKFKPNNEYLFVMNSTGTYNHEEPIVTTVSTTPKVTTTTKKKIQETNGKLIDTKGNEWKIVSVNGKKYIQIDSQETLDKYNEFIKTTSELYDNGWTAWDDSEKITGYSKESDASNTYIAYYKKTSNYVGNAVQFIPLDDLIKGLKDKSIVVIGYKENKFGITNQDKTNVELLYPYRSDLKTYCETNVDVCIFE